MAPKKAKAVDNSPEAASPEGTRRGRYNLRKRPAAAEATAPTRPRKKGRVARAATATQPRSLPRPAPEATTPDAACQAGPATPPAVLQGPLASNGRDKSPARPVRRAKVKSIELGGLRSKSPLRRAVSAGNTATDNQVRVDRSQPQYEDLKMFALYRQIADQMVVVPPWGIVELAANAAVDARPRVQVALDWPETPANVDVDGECSELSEDEEEQLVEEVIISPVKGTADTAAADKAARRESFETKYKDFELRRFRKDTEKRWQKLQTRVTQLEIEDLEKQAEKLTGEAKDSLLRSVTVLKRHQENEIRARIKRNQRRMQAIRTSRAAQRIQIIQASNIKESNMLGKGGQGRVYAWKRKSDIRTVNDEFVVKVGRGKHLNPEKAWLRRLASKSYWHPNIIAFKEEEQIGTESRIWSTIFLMRANLGDLGHLCNKIGWLNKDLAITNPNYTESWLSSYLITDRMLFQWFIQILAGLAYLHEGVKADGSETPGWTPIVHSDLKNGNVLVHWDNERAEYRLMIADFGLAHFEGNERGPVFGATPNCIGPEFNSAASYDVWCAGVMLHELLNHVWIRRAEITGRWLTVDGKHPNENSAQLNNESHCDRWWCQPPHIVAAHMEHGARGFVHCKAISFLMYKLLGRVDDGYQEEGLQCPPFFASRLSSLDAWKMAKEFHDKIVAYMERNGISSFVKAADAWFDLDAPLNQLVEWNEDRFQFEFEMQLEALEERGQPRERTWMGEVEEQRTFPRIPYGVRSAIQIPKDKSALDAYKMVLDAQKDFTFGNVQAAINVLSKAYKEFQDI